jgi:hypothetical protein
LCARDAREKNGGSQCEGTEQVAFVHESSVNKLCEW